MVQGETVASVSQLEAWAAGLERTYRSARVMVIGSLGVSDASGRRTGDGFQASVAHGGLDELEADTAARVLDSSSSLLNDDEVMAVLEERMS